MHLFKRFIATPLLAPEDGSMAGGADEDGHDPGAAGADGADPSTGAADDDSSGDGSDADADHELDAAGSEDDDEELLFGSDDEEPATAGRTAEERLDRLAKKHTKLKRKFGKNWPLLKTLKAEGITERELSNILSKARNYDALQSGDAASKALLRRLLDDDAPATGKDKPGKGKTRQADEDDDDFDESTLPFDTTTENGKFFAAEARERRQLAKAVKTILSRLDQVEGGVNQRFEQTERREMTQKWDAALKGAESKIPQKGLRTMFRDNVVAAFQRTGGKDKSGRPLDPMQVIGHYLKLAGVNPTQAAMARGAAQQRIAQKNQDRPQQKLGPGQATPANSDRPKKLTDVHRLIRTRVNAAAR